jgi:D-amino-acid dehydrogenase
LYQELSRNFDFNLMNTGILQMYKSEEAGKDEIETAEEAKRLGLDVEILTGKEVQKIEQVEVNVAGAVYFKCDSHIYPGRLINRLLEYLKKNNVNVYDDCEITDFEINGSKITAASASSKKLEADYFIIAAGIWSGELSRKLNINLPVQSGKGYSITLKDFKNLPRYPSLLLETRAAVTPMGNDLRLAGTMEIGSNGEEINIKRVRGYLNKIKEYYPGIEPVLPERKEIWFGHRPCSPDGLPYLGKSEKFDNLIFATGHAMMGLSLGPASGKIVQEIIDNEKLSLDLRLFKPERFN